MLSGVVISELLFTVMLASDLIGRRVEMPLVYWTLCSLFMTLGCLGIALRGHIADWISIPIANACIYSSLAMRLAGMRSFASQPPRHWRFLLPSLLLGVLFLFREPLVLDIQRRTELSGIVGLVYGIFMLMDLSRAQREERLVMRRVVLVVIGLQTMNDVVRLLDGVLGGYPGSPLGRYNASYKELLLNVFCVYGVLNIACCMMMFERRENQLVRAATVDGLTGLLNRAGFRQLAERQLQRSRHDRRPVSVVAMDLDHFKKVNDSYGHETGDAVLLAFARCARAALRPTDLVSRPGGEEFWALLADTSLAEAEEIAQRVCDQFRGVRVPSGSREIAATVSLGVAEVAVSESLQAALGRADQALYEAKGQGRDCVRLASRATTATEGLVLAAGG